MSRGTYLGHACHISVKQMLFSEVGQITKHFNDMLHVMGFLAEVSPKSELCVFCVAFIPKLYFRSFFSRCVSVLQSTGKMSSESFSPPELPETPRNFRHFPDSPRNSPKLFVHFMCSFFTLEICSPKPPETLGHLPETPRNSPELPETSEH